MMLSLDVGCSDWPTGDINCDLYIKDTLRHRTPLDAKTTFDLNIKTISNFICCDAQYLPFKDKCFNLVTSRQVIEHVSDPLKMLAELARVSNHRVLVECPHWFGDAVHARSKAAKAWNELHHINALSFKFFRSAADRVGCIVVRTETLSWVGFPSDVFAVLRFPYEIRVILQKKARGIC